MGKTDTLLTMTEIGISSTDKTFQKLVQLYQDQANTIKTFQTSSGCWRNVVTSDDDDDTFIETSATAMFLFSFISGVQQKWISQVSLLQNQFPANYNARFVAQTMRYFQGILTQQSGPINECPNHRHLIVNRLHINPTCIAMFTTLVMSTTTSKKSTHLAPNSGTQCGSM